MYLAGVAAVVGLWFALRLVVLWYFRIDRIVELLEKIAGQGNQEVRTLDGQPVQAVTRIVANIPASALEGDRAGDER